MAKEKNQNLKSHQNPVHPSEAGQVLRPPVVVVLGHIDHGKTTLLDFIRQTKVAEKESGGITQHVGAYEIEHQGKKITFIDTPGHEAFSQIRSRGARVADIAILVVDASEGVKAQTKEAISLIKKSDIPVIIAINKIDKPGADPEKVKRELAKEEILAESMGGKAPAVAISAKTGQGIPELLELILLMAEMENLKADTLKPAEGVIIESYLDSHRGPIATLIVTQGKLKPGQFMGTPLTCGKIKILEDFRGNQIKEALPGQPVLILGFEEVPGAGETLRVCSSIEEAKLGIKTEEKTIPEVMVIGEGQKVLNLILKADVLSSLEAIEEIIKNLPQGKIVLRILKGEVGDVTESDVKLAREAKARILGFRVKINQTAEVLAEREKIRIMQFEVIYDLVEGVRKYMEKLVEPEQVRTELAKIKTLLVFMTEKNRQIVGGRVIEGEVKKGVSIEVERKGQVLGRGRLINLQKNKKDIDRAGKGEEVGLLYEGNVSIEKGDILLIFIEERKKSEL
jgi:translation initiation factor IF-2